MDSPESHGMTFKDKVISLMPHFQQYFKDGVQTAKLLNESVSEAMETFYGSPLPFSKQLRDKSIQLLNAAPEEPGFISSETRRTVVLTLTTDELGLTELEKSMMPSEVPVGKKVWTVYLSRHKDLESHTTRDELRLSVREPGYVQKYDPEARQFVDNYNSPVITDHNDVIAVWLGDPKDTQRVAKVNLGSENPPKYISDVTPNTPRAIMNEVSQRFIEKYERAFGKLDFEKFKGTIVSSGMDQVLDTAKSHAIEDVSSPTKNLRENIESFVKIAFMYCSFYKNHSISHASADGGLFGKLFSQRDLRRPEATYANIALRILNQGHSLNRNEIKNIFEPHMHHASQVVNKHIDIGNN